ncbi:MAG: hypothetical protein KIT58_00925 [Planctomycetota bacterium]|nr:hypothetical protein [Planctomycetota bacterium]
MRLLLLLAENDEPETSVLNLLRTSGYERLIDCVTPGGLTIPETESFWAGFGDGAHETGRKTAGRIYAGW